MTTHFPALVYGPGATGRQMVGFFERLVGVRVFYGAAPDVRTNVLMAMAEEGAQVRNLADTDLCNLADLGDPRIPETIEAFDAAYPGCEFSEEFLYPSE